MLNKNSRAKGSKTIRIWYWQEELAFVHSWELEEKSERNQAAKTDESDESSKAELPEQTCMQWFKTRDGCSLSSCPWKL